MICPKCGRRLLCVNTRAHPRKLLRVRCYRCPKHKSVEVFTAEQVVDPDRGRRALWRFELACKVAAKMARLRPLRAEPQHVAVEDLTSAPVLPLKLPH